jgi:hypothetical protein
MSQNLMNTFFHLPVLKFGFLCCTVFGIHFKGVTQVFPHQWYLHFGTLVESEDSTIHFLSSREIANPHTYKQYMLERYFSNAKADTISISVFEPGTIFYQHRDSTGDLLFCGELMADSTKVFAKELHYMLHDGSDSLAFDTCFVLVPKGEWYLKTTKNIFESVHFVNGLRQGVSEIKIDHPDIPNSVYLIRSMYDRGMLLKSDTIKLPGYKTLKSELVGEWYHSLIFLPDQFHYPLWVFLRMPPSESLQHLYYSSVLGKNGVYTRKLKLECGTGATDVRPEPEKKWKLLDEDEILIADKRYRIVFYNGNFLVLEEIK